MRRLFIIDKDSNLKQKSIIILHQEKIDPSPTEKINRETSKNQNSTNYFIVLPSSKTGPGASNFLNLITQKKSFKLALTGEPLNDIVFSVFLRLIFC